MPETVANEVKPSRPGKLLASDPYSHTFGEQWKRNRCTQLFFFACLIFVVGASLILYSQNKFVPVEFPAGDMIQGPKAVPDEETASIVVLGAQNDRGVLRIAIYETAEGFNDPIDAIRRPSLQILNGAAAIRIPVDTLPDSFAIAVFHDENENGELDRNQLGIPTERYGFSNNARGLTGPPSFEDAKIDCPKVGQSINVSIR